MGYVTLTCCCILAAVAWLGLSGLAWRIIEPRTNRGMDSLADHWILIPIVHLVAGWVLWIYLLVFVPIGLCGVDPNYGGAEFYGQIIGVRKEGAIWKTYEVQLLVGTSGQNSALAYASCPDGLIGSELQRLKGQNVYLRSRRWWSAPWRVGNTDYEIVEVVPLDPEWKKDGP